MAEQEVVDLCENDSDMDELMAFPSKVPQRYSSEVQVQL